MADIKMTMNEVASYLQEGAIWHRMSGNACRRLNLRGWGRIHDIMAEFDGITGIAFEKLVGDNLEHTIMLDMSMASRAASYKIAPFMGEDYSSFLLHHDQWANREDQFKELLEEATALVGYSDEELYHLLFSMTGDVQCEARRVKWIKGNLGSKPTWHDLTVKSKWLHDYATDDYKGGKLDFNIG